jgi:Ca2+-binding EF-hand superfamily protein
VLRTYGLEQEDATVTEENKSHVWKVILDLIDSNHDGVISAEEFDAFCAAGNTLPDFGVGY